MKDIKQIQTISKALHSQKEKIAYELAKINDAIKKKLAIISKMNYYHNEYDSSDNLPLSRSIPVLNKNLNMFTAKVKDVIRHEESELKKIHMTRAVIIKKMEEIDKKIKLMGVFENKHVQVQELKADKQEQLMVDDLVLSKLLRGENE